MNVASVADVPTHTQENRPNRHGWASRPGGTIKQILLQDNAPDGLNFWLRRNLYQGGDKAYHSPRHHHSFQQIRFVESGSVNFAPGQYIGAGEIGYFPRATYYGPQEKDNGAEINVQFGFDGQFQEGQPWDGYRREAIEQLKSRGTFEDGVFVEIDPVTGRRSHTDSIHALYETQYALHTGGEKFVIPHEGYGTPILMHPVAFPYYDAAPGVEIKRLGRFYDQPGPNGDVAVSMVRLSGKGAYLLAAERAQIAWTPSPGLLIEGKTHPELTCVYSPLGQETVISSVDRIEVYVVDFPRRD